MSLPEVTFEQVKNEKEGEKEEGIRKRVNTHGSQDF